MDFNDVPPLHGNELYRGNYKGWQARGPGIFQCISVVLKMVALLLQTHSARGDGPQALDLPPAHPDIPVKEIAGRITVSRYEHESIIETKHTIGIGNQSMLI